MYIYVTTARATTSSQAHIKLNPKKLYQSDGYSVKELLKVYIVYLNLDNVIEIIILMIKMITFLWLLALILDSTICHSFMKLYDAGYFSPLLGDEK